MLLNVMVDGVSWCDVDGCCGSGCARGSDACSSHVASWNKRRENEIEKFSRLSNKGDYCYLNGSVDGKSTPDVSHVARYTGEWCTDSAYLSKKFGIPLQSLTTLTGERPDTNHDNQHWKMIWIKVDQWIPISNPKRGPGICGGKFYEVTREKKNFASFPPIPSPRRANIPT
jgi:hypothetical protein